MKEIVYSIAGEKVTAHLHFDSKKLIDIVIESNAPRAAGASPFVVRDPSRWSFPSARAREETVDFWVGDAYLRAWRPKKTDRGLVILWDTVSLENMLETQYKSIEDLCAQENATLVTSRDTLHILLMRNGRIDVAIAPRENDGYVRTALGRICLSQKGLKAFKGIEPRSSSSIVFLFRGNIKASCSFYTQDETVFLKIVGALY